MAGTRVELTEYVPIEHLRQPDSSVPYYGWSMQTNQFRMSGIQLRAQADPPADASSVHVFDMRVGGDLIIDHCRFAFETPQGERPSTGKLERWQQHSFALLPYGSAPFAVRLTENEFCGAHVNLGNGGVPSPPPVQMTIDRNWIHRTAQALAINLRAASYLVRENILEADAEAIGIDLRGDPGAGGDENAKPFSLINNTVVAAMPVHVGGNQAADPSQQLIPRHVHIHNNLLRSPQNFGVRLYQVPAPHVARLQTAWNVSHNAYVSELLQQVLADNDGNQQQNFPTQPTDLVLPETPFPYNADPSDPEYLRINATGPLAKSGTGGSLPSYIGALPPGPVPKVGDWFSRLRSRGDSISAPSQPSIATQHRSRRAPRGRVGVADWWDREAEVRR